LRACVPLGADLPQAFMSKEQGVAKNIFVCWWVWSLGVRLGVFSACV
jgi:hypothetical protein